jgi:hypothetical protein
LFQHGDLASLFVDDVVELVDEVLVLIGEEGLKLELRNLPYRLVGWGGDI